MRIEATHSYRILLMALAVMLLCSSVLQAQPPAGYYDTVDATNSTTLRQTLHDVIDDHTRFPYTDSSTDTWDIVNVADEDPNNTNNIIDIYKSASYAKIPGGVGAYNREHSWPKSYGFPNDGTDNYPYTDTHHLFACDGGYNSSRSNKPFRLCDAGCSENPTDFNDGRGGGTGVYPGNSNWTSGSFTQGTWETWDGRKGDVARAIFYMDIRYEGGNHGVTGVSEPDLIATDNESLIDTSNTGNNESVAYMGMLSVLLQWHAQDPPDSREQWRNEVVFSFQGNRNPFIDHPEWAECLFNDLCGGAGDTTPPADPTGLVAVAGTGLVDLMWDANGEPDLAGYYVYRATTTGGAYARITGSVVTNNFTPTPASPAAPPTSTWFGRSTTRPTRAATTTRLRRRRRLEATVARPACCSPRCSTTSPPATTASSGSSSTTRAPRPSTSPATAWATAAPTTPIRRRSCRDPSPPGRPS